MLIHIRPNLYYQMLGLIQEDKRIEAMRLFRQATSNGPVTFPISTVWPMIRSMANDPSPKRANHSSILDCIEDINLDQDIVVDL